MAPYCNASARRAGLGSPPPLSSIQVGVIVALSDPRYPKRMKRVLTGITTTGTPHVGNYVGAIRPAIEASTRADTQAFFFLADYHALIKCGDPERIARSRLEIAATWLAAGLDPERVVFYRQSDVPEVTELTWLLTCVTAKGLMNRAHAYKAVVDANRAAQPPLDEDAGVSMGLYSYPVLMAADILLFGAHQVPVGRDQVQHIEMARDIAQRFNHLYGPDLLVLPEAVVDERAATVPGLDGRKMSKSYDNIIPLFAGGERALRDAVMRVVTDATPPGAAKDPQQSTLFKIVQAFSLDAAEQADFERRHRAGESWGQLKEAAFELLNRHLRPHRERYEHYMAHPHLVEAYLHKGGERARSMAQPLLQRLRAAVGLRAPAGAAASVSARKAIKQPRFKRYREADGRFYFKLEDEQGQVLIQSLGFETPQQAGVVMDEMIQSQISQPTRQWIKEGRLLAELHADPAVINRYLELLRAQSD